MKITAHTPSDKAVHITLSPYNGSIALDCEIPALNIRARAFAVYPLVKPKQGATHYLNAYQHSIGLDDANAQLVRDAIAAFALAYEQSPEGQRKALRQRRDDIKCEIAGWWDAMDAAKEHAYEADTGAGWEKVHEYEAKAEAAKAVLRAFDLLHPEILAELSAEADATLSRFLAND
jgi:hypothetical protein